jgi:hypothetical protein
MSRKTRAHRQNREQAVVEDELEVLDAPEEAEEAEETEAHAEEQEDPIEVLQRSVDAANKAKDEAETKAADEARRRRDAEVQRYELENRHVSTDLENRKALIERDYLALNTDADNAERAYAAAMTAGDYAAAAKAQRAMAAAEAQITRLRSDYAANEEQIKSPPRREAPVQDGFEERVKTLHPKIQTWAREHKDDLMSRTQLAYAADQLAVTRGLAIGSDEYLDFMDEQMGYNYEEPEPKKTVTRRAPSVSAPASRSSNNGDATKVYLTSFDKDMAKSLNMTNAEYAKYVRDAPNSNIAKKLGLNFSRGGR